MLVDVIPTLKEVSSQKISGKTVLILDIFRCTSTIVTAFANGCKKIIPSNDRNLALQSKHQTYNSVLLAGEVDGRKMPGAHLGNSPLEYTPGTVRNKTIILTTTNGTEAILRSKPAKNIVIGSFLNVRQASKLLLTFNTDIIIICSGVKGNIALEDIAAAGCFISYLKDFNHSVKLSELSETFYYLYMYLKKDLYRILLASKSGKNLKNLGCTQDISHCLQENIFNVVPVYKENSIQLPAFSVNRNLI